MTGRSILFGDSQLGPYPLEKLPRVGKITTELCGEYEPVMQSENVLRRCVRGDFGERIRQSSTFRTETYPVAEALKETLLHLSTMPENPVSGEKAPLPEDPTALSRYIKRLTYFYGADMVGICEVPRGVLYLDAPDKEPIDDKLKYAIVFLLRKEPETVGATHGDEWIDDASSFAAYQRLALISVTLAHYIMRIGYGAKASFYSHYYTLMPRLIVEAGLGEFSRMGIALNPFIGASYKAACVLCDLPLMPDKPIDFGLQSYCSRCTVCTEQCPSGAITSGEKTVYGGAKSWFINKEKCAKYCMSHKYSNICQRCTVVCPFTRPDTGPERFKGWDGNLGMIYADVEARRKQLEENDFLNPGEKDRKWWLAVKEINGVIREVPDYDYSEHDFIQKKKKRM